MDHAHCFESVILSKVSHGFFLSSVIARTIENHERIAVGPEVFKLVEVVEERFNALKVEHDHVKTDRVALVGKV